MPEWGRGGWFLAMCQAVVDEYHPEPSVNLAPTVSGGVIRSLVCWRCPFARLVGTRGRGGLGGLEFWNIKSNRVF